MEQQTNPELQESEMEAHVRNEGVFIVFMKRRLFIAKEIVDEYSYPFLSLILVMIELHGWRFYEKLKVNYNIGLPAELESIINVLCMEEELNGNYRR